jgi:hypothetical protein
MVGSILLMHDFLGGHNNKEFCYSVSEVSERYLRFFLILAVDFYYVINKLIILVPDLH